MAIKFVDKDPEDDKPKKAARPAKAEVKAEAVTPEAAPSVDRTRTKEARPPVKPMRRRSTAVPDAARESDLEAAQSRDGVIVKCRSGIGTAGQGQRQKRDENDAKARHAGSTRPPGRRSLLCPPGDRWCLQHPGPRGE